MKGYNLKYFWFYKLAVQRKLKKYYRGRVINNLLNKDYKPVLISNILKAPLTSVGIVPLIQPDAVEIFGLKIDINHIDWHKDLKSGYVFPVYRFDEYNFGNMFGKGIDVKFPWELSRSYFLINLGLQYSRSKDGNIYKAYRNIISDWIDKNTFLYGVNWLSPMEAGIRAINWIVSAAYFTDEINDDADFKRKLSISLQQHGDFIYNFAEIYGRHTTNHTTFNFGGLLFISLALRNYRRSRKWFAAAVSGLEFCIKDQTYEDGVNFEASIPYHRLVLEMFSYAAILMSENGLQFSNGYNRLLFKMFEYAAAYMDKKGNFPLIGDNDSGKLLLLSNSELDNQTYLVALGTSIFDYDFGTNISKKDSINHPNFASGSMKIDPSSLGIKTRDIVKSQAFHNSGFFIFKNDDINISINCQTIGQRGINGHNHNDWGSFTLYYKGVPFVIDPGLYGYTRDLQLRNLFRSASCHNVAQIEREEYFEFSENARFLWKMNDKNKLSILYSSLGAEEDIVRISYSYINYPDVRHERDFIFDKLHNKFIVKDLISSAEKRTIYNRINLHPKVAANFNTDSIIMKSCGEKMELKSNIGLSKGKGLYSSQYGIMTETLVLEQENIVSDSLIIENIFQGL